MRDPQLCFGMERTAKPVYAKNGKKGNMYVFAVYMQLWKC